MAVHLFVYNPCQYIALALNTPAGMCIVVCICCEVLVDIDPCPHTVLAMADQGQVDLFEWNSKSECFRFPNCISKNKHHSVF